eukprot:3106247-Karenia_brevis.AAC.1
MVNALALSKGRTSAAGLIRPVRQASSLLLRSDVVAKIRWLPSELNGADRPSRGVRMLGGGFFEERERSSVSLKVLSRKKPKTRSLLEKDQEVPTS